MNKANVRNSADEEQVEEGKRASKDERRQELEDIKTVLSNASGRRLIWRLMGKCRTFSSVWEPSAKIHYNAGQQDLGHFIMAEIVEADANLLLKMMKEQKEGK
jgi:hypothetical protein